MMLHFVKGKRLAYSPLGSTWIPSDFVKQLGGQLHAIAVYTVPQDNVQRIERLDENEWRVWLK